MCIQTGIKVKHTEKIVNENSTRILTNFCTLMFQTDNEVDRMQ